MIGWEGWGTALKPGYEPIILARKPFRGSLVANIRRHGTGGLNIEGCRLDTGPGDDVDGDESDLGRWPTNLLLDAGAAALLDAQSGELVSGANPTRRSSDKFRDIYGAFAGQDTCEPARGRYVGGASRFFYVAKPSREERDLGCEDLPMRSACESTDRKEGSAGLNSPRAGAGRTGGGRNCHPTVKPLALARWLVRLVTPPGGRVIVPFLGSGTEGMACIAEGVAFDGIEREAEYIEIARRRIRAIAPLFADEATLITQAAVGD